MRLSTEKVIELRENFKDNIKNFGENNVVAGSKLIENFLDTIEALQAENEQLQAQMARVKEVLRKVREALDYWRELYGIGLEVLNWHMNGDIETFDSFYDSSGTYEALAEIDKAIGGKEDDDR